MEGAHSPTQSHIPMSRLSHAQALMHSHTQALTSTPTHTHPHTHTHSRTHAPTHSRRSSRLARPRYITLQSRVLPGHARVPQGVPACCWPVWPDGSARHRHGGHPLPWRQHQLHSSCCAHLADNIYVLLAWQVLGTTKEEFVLERIANELSIEFEDARQPKWG